jgi:predicted amidohydrolase YtcJ
VNRREQHTGTLRVGAAADLVLLDQDPFAVPADELGGIGVAGTWVDGQQCH